MRPCPHALCTCLLKTQRLVGVAAAAAPEGAAAGVSPVQMPLALTVVELAMAVAAAAAEAQQLQPLQLLRQLRQELHSRIEALATEGAEPITNAELAGNIQIGGNR